MSSYRPLPSAVLTVALLAVSGVGCSRSAPPGAPPPPGAGAGDGPRKAAAVAVRAGDSSCDVAATELPAGTHTFTVENVGSRVTEVYVYAGDRILGEVENVGPATQRALVIELAAGDYEVACKPGMTGDGIRRALHVTAGAATPSPAASTGPATEAVAAYRKYVEAETAALVQSTRTFTAAVSAGKVAAAKVAYAEARRHYERIEPIAESFGDLDPLIDMRADDAATEVDFTGFHRLERDLWQRNDISADAPVAAALQANVERLAAKIPDVDISPLTMANGAKGLLDEVAKSKVTGEEERYSHIDLVDFAGNVEGRKAAYDALRPLLTGADAALVATLDERFATLTRLLSAHEHDGSFPAYPTLASAQIRTLADAVTDLSEPLGELPAALAKG